MTDLEFQEVLTGMVDDCKNGTIPHMARMILRNFDNSEGLFTSDQVDKIKEELSKLI